MTNRAVRVVLARPRNPLNIGAAARAMANFGHSELVVLEPFEPVWRETRSGPAAGAVGASGQAGSFLEGSGAESSHLVRTSSFPSRGPVDPRPPVSLPDCLS